MNDPGQHRARRIRFNAFSVFTLAPKRGFLQHPAPNQSELTVMAICRKIGQ
jgi:hypothetical protein